MAKIILSTILFLSFIITVFSANFVTDSWIAFLVSNSTNAPKISYHSAVLNPVNNTMLVFGGSDSNKNSTSTFIKYDVLQDSWGEPINTTNIPNAPSPRYGHVALTTLENKMFIFGGRNEDTVFNDIYKYDMEKDIWEKINVTGNIPNGRWGHSGVVYSLYNCFYFFGGQSDIVGGYLNDIVVFDFEFNQWRSFSVNASDSSFIPSPRTLHTATLTLTNHMVVFGGKNSTKVFNDVYILSLEQNVWINATLNQDSRTADSKYGHSAILTPMGTVLVYGGYQDSAVNPTATTTIYKFDIATLSWEYVSSTSGLGPEARAGHTAVATLFNTMLIFGGGDSTSLYNNIFKYNVINSVLRSTSDGTTVVVLLSLLGVMIIGLCFALDIMAEKNEIARLEQLEKDAIAKNNEIALKKILLEKKEKLKNQPLFEKF